MFRSVTRLLTLLLALITASALPLPPAAVASAAPAVHGLKGEYFAMSAPGARDFAVPGGSALDPNVEFGNLVPTFQALTGRGEHTTARWTGRLTAPATADYTFHAIGDNGFRLFLDGAPVIDHWVGDWDVEQRSAPVRLEAGVAHEFRLELFQDTGGANMFLRWSAPGVAKSIVPESAFTPPADFEVYPLALSTPAGGRTVLAEFDGRITALGDFRSHVAVEVDTVPFPISSVNRKDDDKLVITLGEAVLKGQRIRLRYDGAGGLAVGGKPVPKLYRSGINNSVERLTTPWTNKVNKNQPLPEYPRPQQERRKWSNLNGQWEFAGAAAGEQPVFGKALAEKITVPYPVESLLSGIERHEDHMFYRRTFTVPQDWNVGRGQRLKLNFGAVDYRATVWVNGVKVTEHEGGYTAFTADVTDALGGRRQHELVVAVTDTTGAEQPVGKQTSNPSGIFYTASSGIWQTVWLEPVPDRAIDDVVSTPDIATGTLSVTVRSATSPGGRVTVTAKEKGGRKVGSVTGAANSALTVPVPKARLWSPEDPYLYDLEVVLEDGRSKDVVSSYFGMRSIGVAQVNGFPKLVLNGKPVFSLAQLDQGFWPDGLNTAPTDAALEFDLKAQKDLGYNAVRKHIKVEPARWFYHADRLGLLVWQDFVSGTFNTEAGRTAFQAQGAAVVEQHRSSPSVIGWIVFNEGWGEWDREETGRITERVQASDPSRVVNAHSGVNCCASKGDSGKGDVIDHHDYNNDSPPWPDATRVAMDGEHGGFTLRTPGHQWPGAPTAIYSGVASKAELTAKYVSNTEQHYLQAAGAELSGSVYTQVTDLETELNGLWTYDRREIKVDPGPVREINRKVIEAGAAAGTYRYPAKGTWSLDEGQGAVGRDTSGGGSDLSVTGATWAEGLRGTALSFTGSNQYAQTRTPVVDTRADYTISAWVTLDGVPTNWVTAVSQDGRRRENPFYLQYGQGGFAFSGPGGHRAVSQPVTPEAGRWYHLVGVHDAAKAEFRLYVDGALAGTTQAGEPHLSTGPLSIGRAKYAGGNVDFWKGKVDQVQAFGKALTGAEVAELHSAR